MPCSSQATQSQPSPDTVPICPTHCPKRLPGGPCWSAPSHFPCVSLPVASGTLRNTHGTSAGIQDDEHHAQGSLHPWACPAPSQARQAMLPVICPPGSGNLLSTPPALKTSAIFHGFLGDPLIHVYVHDSDSELRGQELLECGFTAVSPVLGTMPNA